MRKAKPADLSVDQLRELGYERSDVSLPTLVRWIIFLFVFVGFCSLTSWVIYRVFVPEIRDEPMANGQAQVRTVPGDPQIQAAPKRDLREFRLGEERVLNTYGWADKAAGTVHVPVNVAMEMIAQHGLPPRASGPIPSTAVQPSPNVEGGLTLRPGETGAVIPRTQPILPRNEAPPPAENPAEPQGPTVGGGVTPGNGRQPGTNVGPMGTERNSPGSAAGTVQPNPNHPSSPNNPPR
jgi:hypothetical protein